MHSHLHVHIQVATMARQTCPLMHAWSSTKQQTQTLPSSPTTEISTSSFSFLPSMLLLPNLHTHPHTHMHRHTQTHVKPQATDPLGFRCHQDPLRDPGCGQGCHSFRHPQSLFQDGPHLRKFIVTYLYIYTHTYIHTLIITHAPTLATHNLQHPDKCQDDPEATARFQALSIIHATLSDEEKRRNYDETGEIEEQDADLNQSEKEWYDYWRAMFPAVTVEKIQQFQGEYKGSEEEKGDVLRIYEECEGKMTEVIDNVMLASDGMYL